MVFVLTDDNTTVFIIPKEKADPLLLELCQEFSQFIIIQKNDDGGHFSNEIVSYERITECVEGLEEPVYSRVFRSVFDSKSTNNAGFLLAVLRHESLLKTGDDGKHYIQPNWDKWEKTTLALKPEEVDLPYEFTDWSAKNAKAK